MVLKDGLRVWGIVVGKDLGGNCRVLGERGEVAEVPGPVDASRAQFLKLGDTEDQMKRADVVEHDPFDH